MACCRVPRVCGRFTPTGKQASELTCLAWGKVPSAGPASASKKKKAKQVHEVVAIGNAVGGVLLWDCTRSELRQTFGGEGSGHTGKVSDVALNAAGTLLYTCTTDCKLTCWNVSTGEQSWHVSVGKHAAHRLLVHGDDDEVVTGSTAIKVWDVSSRTSTRKLRGHATVIVCMAYSPDHKYLVSAARDRFILVWEAAGESSDPLLTLTLDASPLHLSMRNCDDDDSKAELLAVSDAGGAAIWRFSPHMHQEPKSKGSAKKASKSSPASTPRDVRPLTPSCAIAPGSGKGRMAVCAARFQGEAGESVQVCGGSQALPTFLDVKVRDAKGVLLAHVPLAGKGAGAHGLLLGTDESKTPKGKGGKDGRNSAAAQVSRAVLLCVCVCACVCVCVCVCLCTGNISI